MANYYAEASFMIPFKDSEADFLMSALIAIDDVLDRCDHDLTCLDDEFKAEIRTEKGDKTMDFILDFIDNCADGECCYLDFDCDKEADGLWVHNANEYINATNAAAFISAALAHFDRAGGVGFEISYTCTKPRLDAFGGMAVFVTKDSIEYLSTSQWIRDQYTKHGEASD